MLESITELPLSVALLQGALYILFIYIVSSCVYNYFFHPLSRYPGPRLAAISELWLSGRWAVTLLGLSQTYGPVVRIAPNELLFTTLPAFEEIYGHSNNKKSRATFLKSSFYDNPDEMSPLGAERDPVYHANARRLLAHAYSESSLSEQAPLLIKHVDGFVKQLAKFGKATEGVKVDEWFNWLTFDIIGSLAFGESFHAVEEAQPNPAITALMNVLYTGSVINVFQRMPYLLPLAPLVIPISRLRKERVEHQEFSRELIRKRIAKGIDHENPDFFGHLMNENDKAKTKQPFNEFLRTNASSLLIAGSETTATALAGITYYVLERPQCLRALQEEIRNCFNNHADINEASTRPLLYVNAVIKEALRIFVPLPINVPRVSPGAVVDGHYIPKGTIVSGHQYTLGHHPKYFTDPESFHPERWLPTDHPLYNSRYAGDNLEASKPFLIGPRTCLGKNLAYLELRLILTKLVFLFDWKAVQELGIGKEVDWARDTRTQFLWAKPELRVRYTLKAQLN